MTPHDYNRIIRRLPTMPLEEMLKIKLTATIALSHPGQHLANAARRCISAIHHEYDRRRKNNEYFKWPNTNARIGHRALQTSHWQRDGLLSRMHYTVGQTNGLKTAARQAILEDIFLKPLPPINCPDYMAEWGAPETATRLKKMAESIAAFARNAKRRQDRNMATAIDDWEKDLRHLHETFYAGHFGFNWPTTGVRNKAH